MSRFLRGVSKALESVAGIVRRAHASLVEHQLARHSSFSFTTDFVTSYSATWNECLAAFRGRPGVRMLEIGSLEGRSAIWFLQHILTHPSCSITCLDLWSHPLLSVRFDHNVRLAGVAEKVRKIRARSAEGLLALESERFDIVYIDGSHSAFDVLMDAALSWPLVLPDGVLMFDDYEYRSDLPPLARPKLAIDRFLGLIEGQYDLVHQTYQLYIRKRPAPRSD